MLAESKAQAGCCPGEKQLCKNAVLCLFDGAAGLFCCIVSANLFIMISILIAPDKFKGSLTTFEVCTAIEEGLLQALTDFRIVKCPMADGGDGLGEVISYYTGAIKQSAQVQDPLGRTIKADGGMSAGSVAFLKAKLESGIDLVMQYANLEEHLPGADYVLTGEGKIDEQTLKGKVVMGVALLAKKHSKPVIAFLWQPGHRRYRSCCPGHSCDFPRNKISNGLARGKRKRLSLFTRYSVQYWQLIASFGKAKAVMMDE